MKIRSAVKARVMTRCELGAVTCGAVVLAVSVIVSRAPHQVIRKPEPTANSARLGVRVGLPECSSAERMRFVPGP